MRAEPLQLRRPVARGPSSQATTKRPGTWPARSLIVGLPGEVRWVRTSEKTSRVELEVVIELELYPGLVMVDPVKLRCGCLDASFPEVKTLCGLLGVNEKPGTVEDPLASADPATATAPAIARASTTMGRFLIRD